MNLRPLLPWLKNKNQQAAEAQQPPSSAQLESELEAVRQEHQSHLRVIGDAQQRFDQSGDDDDLKAIKDAKAHFERVEMHVARLERLIGAAKQREEEQFQREHAERVAAAKASFCQRMAEDEELIRQEVHLLKQLIDVRVTRRRTRELAHECLRPYGGVGPEVNNWHSEVTPDGHRVRHALEAMMDGDPRSTMIQSVFPRTESYVVSTPYFGLGSSRGIEWDQLEPLVSKKPKPHPLGIDTSLGRLSQEPVREPTLVVAKRAQIENGEVLSEPKGGPVRLVGLDRGAVVRRAPVRPGPSGGYVDSNPHAPQGGPVALGEEFEGG